MGALLARDPRPVHVVARGDTLSAIARTRRVGVADLREWNGIRGDRIEPGQRLFVAPPASLGARLLALLPGSGEDPAGEGGPSGGRTREGRGRPRARGKVSRASPLSLAPPSGEAPLAPLTLPPARPCLDAAEAGVVDGDEGSGLAVERSAGLTAEAARGAVAAFQPQARRCFRGHEGVYGQLVLEVSVGCDGRVREAAVVDDTVYDAAFAACIADVFRYAPFEAHGRDEVVFQIPLTFDRPARTD